MKFIANTVYEYRALIEDKDDQLFLLLKMIEYEERETYLENFSQRHHIECYILIIMGRLCKADPERLDDLFGDTETLRRLIKKVVRNIRSVIVVKDKGTCCRRARRCPRPKQTWKRSRRARRSLKRTIWKPRKKPRRWRTSWVASSSS